MHRTTLILVAAALACGVTPAQSAAKKPAAKAATAKKLAPRKAPLPPADDDQRGAAELAHVGDYACELNQTVNVALNPTQAAYVDVRFGKRLFTMKPVRSSTGALRLEEVRGDALMIQIPFKSMLFDTRLGRRLVDECVHPKQSLAKEAADKEAPLPGLGIDPARAAPAPEDPASAPEPALPASSPASAAG